MENNQESENRQQLNTDPLEWVDLYGDYLFRYALTRVRGEHAAEDIVQETFLSALQSRSKFQGRSAERTWLTGIMKNKIFEYYRKNARYSDGPLAETFDACHEELMDKYNHWEMNSDQALENWAPSPSQSMENGEFWIVMQSCIGKLPEKASQVYTMREIDGWETAAICEATGVTESNLGVLLHRCRFLLRRCLELNWFLSSDKSKKEGKS